MKPFMENICMHPHCQGTDCKNCCHFTPKAYGIKVPKWIGHVLFNLEAWLVEREFKKMDGKF